MLFEQSCQHEYTADDEWVMDAGDVLDRDLVLLGFRLPVKALFVDTAAGDRSLHDTTSWHGTDCQIPLVGLQVSSGNLVPIGHCTHSFYPRHD